MMLPCVKTGEVDNLEKRKLGASLEVSAIGYGCMGLSYGYGVALEKSEALSRIHEALDLGYTFFDTSEVYVGQYADGSAAINEELVGEALRPHRKDVIIATKGGIRLDDNKKIVPDGRPESLRHSLEQSLKRMKIETIDLYFQHRPDPDVEPEEVAYAMLQFIKEGKIRFWGVSNGSEEYIRRADAGCKITAVQCRYSMMARWNEALFPILEKLDIGFVAFSPLANGFLSGKFLQQANYDKNLDYRSWMPQYSEEGICQAKALLEFIEKLAREKNGSPAQISLAWELCKKPWIVPIPGSSKSARIRENAEAANIQLSKEEMESIDMLLAQTSLEVFGQQENPAK